MRMLECDHLLVQLDRGRQDYGPESSVDHVDQNGLFVLHQLPSKGCDDRIKVKSEQMSNVCKTGCQQQANHISLGRTVWKHRKRRSKLS